MENKAITLLEKIKNGSILEELTEYEDLQWLTKQRKILDYVICLNEKCRFPRNKDARKNFNYGASHVPFEYFIDKELVFDTTMPELISVFGYYSSRRRNLPKELSYATWNDIENFRCGRSRGSSKSWVNKIESPRALVYQRYHIALISKKKVPVFSSAFAFLDYLNSKLESKQAKN
jgi:hypothetical protein